MFYTIYKITNIITGKIYIGSHKTKNLNDNYMGSGEYLKNSQLLHGIENFKKEILFVFDTAEEMYKKEAEIVDETFISKDNTYNLKLGGVGGWDHVNSNESLRKEKNIKARQAADKTINCKYSVNNPAQTQSAREKLSKSMLNRIEKGYVPRPPSFNGKKHSEESKNRMRAKKSGRNSGKNNSQYGTTWIWHELFGNKKISKELLPHYIDQGWIKAYKPNYIVP